MREGSEESSVAKVRSVCVVDTKRPADVTGAACANRHFTEGTFTRAEPGRRCCRFAKERKLVTKTDLSCFLF
jgi:hypothetical protein